MPADLMYTIMQILTIVTVIISVISVVLVIYAFWSGGLDRYKERRLMSNELLDVLKTIGVRLTRGTRFLFWAADTMQWEVYDKAAPGGRRVVPLLIATDSFEEALAKLMGAER